MGAPKENAYGLTDEQLAAARAWLERARAWTKANPEADFYPCGRRPCACGDCRPPRALARRGRNKAALSRAAHEAR